MNVALLTTPQAKYADYWLAYLGALGLDIARPLAPFETWLEAGQGSLPEEPLLVQTALGEILALGPEVDAVLVPQTDAVKNDAWAEALADLLPQRIAGLPPLLAVPDRAEDLQTAAADLGQRLLGHPAKVARALEKVEPLGRRARREEWPALQQGQQPSVGVIGPRALLEHAAFGGALVQAIRIAGLHPVVASQLPLSRVEQRGERLESSHAKAGDKLLYGAARLLEGKGVIGGLILASPARDAAVSAALDRLEEGLHKPTLRLTVEAGQESWPELGEFASQLGASRAVQRPD